MRATQTSVVPQRKGAVPLVLLLVAFCMLQEGHRQASSLEQCLYDLAEHKFLNSDDFSPLLLYHNRPLSYQRKFLKLLSCLHPISRTILFFFLKTRASDLITKSYQWSVEALESPIPRVLSPTRPHSPQQKRECFDVSRSLLRK